MRALGQLAAGLVLAACTPEPSPIRAHTGTADTADTAHSEPSTTSGTWTLGAEEACTDPLPTVAWTDHSDQLWGGDPVEAAGQPAGCIAVEPVGADWLITATVAGGDLAWTTPGGTPTTQEISPGVVRLRVLDLDGDGVSDALIFARSLQVGWSYASDDAVWEVLVAETEGCMIGELGVIDLDGDGDLDLVAADLAGCNDPESYAGGVLENQGDRQFVASDAAAEIDPGFWGVPFDTLTLDIDDDGDPDQYWCHDLGNEVAPNGWLLNEGGILVEAPDQGADIAAHCMGVSAGDVDGDGHWDLYVGANREHMLLMGSESGWIDYTQVRELPDFGEAQMAWGSAFVDIDNDGLLDLTVTTSDFATPSWQPYPIWMLRQQEDGTFTEDSAELGFAQETAARGLVATDLNSDGVVDFVIADAMRPPWLFLSEGCTDDAWLTVEAPRGSIVRVEAEGRSWQTVASADPGFAASQPAVAHLGLGDAEVIDRVVVDVPWQGEAVLAGPLSPRRRLVLSSVEDPVE